MNNTPPLPPPQRDGMHMPGLIAPLSMWQTAPVPVRSDNPQAKPLEQIVAAIAGDMADVLQADVATVLNGFITDTDDDILTIPNQWLAVFAQWRAVDATQIRDDLIALANKHQWLADIGPNSLLIDYS